MRYWDSWEFSATPLTQARVVWYAVMRPVDREDGFIAIISNWSRTFLSPYLNAGLNTLSMP